ncbi:MAG: NAD-binding protein [Kiritimatiellae bacterium]|nr:NAD-binding protein [Kiritimatiellia bacterium]
MKAIIIGAGFTGVQLARTLVAEDNNVTLIDNDAERVRNALDQLDCAVIEADGNNLTVLDDAGIASSDVLIALTEDDELNMITCSLVDSQYPDLLKIARVRNYAYYMNSGARRNGSPEQVADRPNFGIDHMVHPDVEAADAICRAMSHGAVGNVIEIGDGYGIVTLTINKSSPLLGKSLRDLSQFPEWKYIVAYVETAKGETLACGSTVLKEGDRFGVVASEVDIPNLQKFVGDTDRSPLRRVAIFGAGRIGSLIVERQMSMPNSANSGAKGKNTDDIIMVDANRKLCTEAAQRFNGVQVLCGDITDENLIAEESLHSCDLMVAASDNYDRNLITASYLKSRGVRRTIALTSGSDFDDISRKLGIDVTVPLRDTFVDCIMSRLRGRNVKSVHTVCNRAFEIVECCISKDGKVAGKKIKDISVPGEFLVLLAKREDGSVYSIPGGDTLLEAGDRVVVAVKSGDVRVIRKFAGRK